MCIVDEPVNPSASKGCRESGRPLFEAFVGDGDMDDDRAGSPEDDPLLWALEVSVFDDAPSAIAPGAAGATADGDDAWFERAGDGIPAVDEGASAAREAIGAAALSLDRELARRPPRRPRRRHSASTSAERGGRRPRDPRRLVGAGVLALLVGLSLAIVTGAPRTREGDDRSARVLSATTAFALKDRGDAVVRRRRRMAAVRRADRRVARRQLARARSRRMAHRRRRSRPVARRPAAPAPAPSVAVAPAARVVVVRPAAAPVRRVARRPVRSPDPSFTPGDLPPASEAP